MGFNSAFKGLIHAQSTSSEAENQLVEHKPEGALTHFHLIAQFGGRGVLAQFDGQRP